MGADRKKSPAPPSAWWPRPPLHRRECSQRAAPSAVARTATAPRTRMGMGPPWSTAPHFALAFGFFIPHAPRGFPKRRHPSLRPALAASRLRPRGRRAPAAIRATGAYVYPRCVSLASLGGLGAASLILWKPAFPAMPPCVLHAACLACDVALSLSAGLIACCHPRSNASPAMTYGRDCRDDPSAGEARRPPARGDVRAREPGPPPGNM